MKKRSSSGNVGVGVFIVTLVCVCVAFGTPSWLVSDTRITGARLNKLGLWNHCFRSLPDPQEPATSPSKFYVGCRWVYDPFTTGYSDIRGFLIPPFMVATQFFFTLCFFGCLISFGLVLFYTLCSDPEQKRYVQLIQTIGFVLLFAGVTGCLAVIIFASLGNGDKWMPGHENNFFGWSFILGVVGSILAIISAILFLAEADIQKKKRNYLKESQTRIQMDIKTPIT